MSVPITYHIEDHEILDRELLNACINKYKKTHTVIEIGLSDEHTKEAKKFERSEVGGSGDSSNTSIFGIKVLYNVPKSYFFYKPILSPIEEMEEYIAKHLDYNRFEL